MNNSQIPTFLSPSISVITVHDQQDTLFRLVSSVNWQLEYRDELIIVDDGSDRSPEEGLGSSSGNQMLIRNHSAKGNSNCKNLGINRSIADWIKPLAADDILAPFGLSALRNVWANLSNSVQVVAGGTYRRVNARLLRYQRPELDNFRCLNDVNPAPLSATFIRRSCFEAVGGFDPRFGIHEDWEFWLRVRQRFGIASFATIDQPLCYFSASEPKQDLKDEAKLVDGVPIKEYLLKHYPPPTD